MKITTMKVTTKMRAGALVPNHNQSTQSLRCKTALKAGPALTVNHNQAASSGLRTKTSLKAGPALTVNHNETVATAPPEIEPSVLDTISDSLRVPRV